MTRTPDLPRLDEFLREMEQHVALSVFFTLAVEHGLLACDDLRGWAERRLAELGYPEQWLSSLATAQSVTDVRAALADHTESVPVAGYWGYYDLLEVGMRCLAERRGHSSFGEVLEESTTSLRHKPVYLDEAAVCAAMNHARGVESHPAEYAQVEEVCRRLADHAERLFGVMGLPLRAPTSAPR